MQDFQPSAIWGLWGGAISVQPLAFGGILGRHILNQYTPGLVGAIVRPFSLKETFSYSFSHIFSTDFVCWSSKVVDEVCFGPGGNLLASFSNDKTVRL